MSKIILLPLLIFCISVGVFSQEARNQPLSSKMLKALEQNLPEWNIFQAPKLGVGGGGLRNDPMFTLRMRENRSDVNVEVRFVEDEETKELLFRSFFMRPIMPRSSKIVDFVEKGFLAETAHSAEARFSKANLVIDVRSNFPTKQDTKKTLHYYLPSPKEEKDKVLKIVEVLAKAIEAEVNLDDCQNTFFKFHSLPNDSLEDKLLSASASGDAIEVAEILKRNVNPNYRLSEDTDFAYVSYGKDNTALHFAARQGCAETIKALIAAKADVNAVNERGETPLMLAVYHGNFEAARFLISANADVQRESFGRNAAFYTVRATQTISVGNSFTNKRLQKMPEATGAILKELAAKGLDLKKKDSRGANTLLTELLENSYTDYAFEVSKMLLEFGVDPNEINHNGATPLLILANNLTSDNIKIIKFLISQGADVNKRDRNNRTALNILLKKQIEYKANVDYSKIISVAIEILKNAGAKE